MSFRGESKLIFLLLGLSLIRGLIYSAIVPPWQAPDEPRHFEYVKLLYEKGRLVGWGDVTPSVEQEIIASMDKYDYWSFGASEFRYSRPDPLPKTFQEVWGEGCHELHQPPLSYLLYLIPLLFTSAEDTVIQLYAMRLVSIVLSAMIVLTAFLTAEELFPGDNLLLLGIPIFVVFLPMHTFLTSSVNNDHLAELSVSLVVLGLVRIFRRGFTWLTMGVTFLFVVMGLLSKRISLVLIPISAIAGAMYLWGRNWRVMVKNKQFVLRVSLMAALVALGICFSSDLLGWLRQLSPGFADGRNFVDWIARIYLFLPSEQFPFSLNQRYFSAEALTLYRRYILTMFESFWGCFGWMNIPLYPLWYRLLAMISMVAFVGLWVFAVRAVKRRLLARWQWQSLLLFCLSVLFTLFTIIANEVRRWDLGWGGWPQGRYLFIVIIPIATLFTIGLRELSPVRYRKLWVLPYIAGFVVLDWICLIRYIIPFYYG